MIWQENGQEESIQNTAWYIPLMRISLRFMCSQWDTITPRNNIIIIIEERTSIQLGVLFCFYKYRITRKQTEKSTFPPIHYTRHLAERCLNLLIWSSWSYSIIQNVSIYQEIFRSQTSRTATNIWLFKFLMIICKVVFAQLNAFT